MGAIIELLIDYEVLVAAVREALSSKSIDFDKESDIGGTVFKLRHWQLGDNMGEVKVRKVGDHRSELFYEDPPYLPSDRRTPDADLVEQNKKMSRKILDALNDGKSAIAIDLLQQGAELTGKIYEQEEELYRRKKRYFEQAIQAMFNWLYHDHLLQRALQAEGNEEAIRQLAWWAGKELPATTDEPQADSGAVGEQVTPAEDEGGKKPGPIDTKLDALLAGQTAIIERLDQGQLATVQAVLDAIEAGLVPMGELEETLVAMQHTLSEIQQQGVALPDSILTSEEVERLSEVILAPKLDIKHKLKFTVPIIPSILAYERELELKSELNLEAIWKRLMARVRGT